MGLWKPRSTWISSTPQAIDNRINLCCSLIPYEYHIFFLAQLKIIHPTGSASQAGPSAWLTSFGQQSRRPLRSAMEYWNAPRLWHSCRLSTCKGDSKNCGVLSGCATREHNIVRCEIFSSVERFLGEARRERKIDQSERSTSSRAGNGDSCFLPPLLTAVQRGVHRVPLQAEPLLLLVRVRFVSRTASCTGA